MKMIEIKGEHTTAKVQGDEEMFDEAFFNQIESITNHEAFQNEIVIMPDGHAGAGAVIGFTMPFGEKLTPNVVGSDIGCGVSAINIGVPSGFDSAEENDRSYWRAIDKTIRESVPMGLGKTHSDTDYHIVNDFPWDKCQKIRDEFNYEFENEVEYGKEYFMDLCSRVGLDVNNVISSMGTLGSGNHFLEVSKSQKTGEYWIVVHSGSRCVGGAVSGYWQEKASERVDAKHVQDNIEEWMWEYVKFDEETPPERIRQWVYGGMGSSFYEMDKIRKDFSGEEIENRRQELLSLIPDEKREEELDFVTDDDMEGYITDMIFAQQYARENRRVMLFDVMNALDIEHKEYIDSIHNYIDFEDGVIRKGATQSREGEKLIIPFNMAEGAVICRGKGEPEYNNSAPHGAGRRGSRRWAYDTFDVERFEKEMEGVHSLNDKEEVLDEIPSAYKSSDDILDWLEPTAEVEEELTPILNMKGE